MDLASARIAFDPAAVVAAFAAIPELREQPPEHAEFSALWVKPGRHYHAAYEVRCGRVVAPRLASACGLGPASATAIVTALGPHQADALCRHCSVAVVEPGVLVQLFPLDYRLPTLPACLDVARVSRALAPHTVVSAARPAGYRPGMRCQVRYETTRGTIYGKVAVERERGDAFARHEQIARASENAGGRVRVASPLTYVPDLQLTLIDAAPGESLYEGLHRQRDLTDMMPLAAYALAAFHRLRVDGIRRVHAVADEMALVESWAELVASWIPSLAPELRRALSALGGCRPADVAPRAFVHRDFYDKQVLVGGDGVVLLDLDTACWGDPEIDVGNFSAQLVLRGLQLDTADTCAAYAEAFTRSFPAPLAPDRVRWYRCATLLRLACGYALRPRWQRLAPALITEALRP